MERIIKVTVKQRATRAEAMDDTLQKQLLTLSRSNDWHSAEAIIDTQQLLVKVTLHKVFQGKI